MAFLHDGRVMTQQQIISAITSTAGIHLSLWQIGITQDPSERKAHWRDTEHQDVRYWTEWPADSLADARDIEALFKSDGMKSGVGGDLSPSKPTYVYVF